MASRKLLFSAVQLPSVLFVFVVTLALRLLLRLDQGFECVVVLQCLPTIRYTHPCSNVSRHTPQCVLTGQLQWHGAVYIHTYMEQNMQGGVPAGVVKHIGALRSKNHNIIKPPKRLRWSRRSVLAFGT